MTFEKTIQDLQKFHKIGKEVAIKEYKQRVREAIERLDVNCLYGCQWKSELKEELGLEDEKGGGVK